MDELARALRLRRETVRQRIALIDTDIDVGMTFLRIAATELSMGNSARADDLLAKARMAYTTTAKFLPGVADVEEWQHLHDKHQALADAIRGAERRQRRQEGEKPPGDA